MLKDEFRRILKERETVDNEDYYSIDLIWKKETDILSKNIEETIAFLDNECTADEFSWISEVFHEIVEITQSREFIDCLYRVAEKFPEESEKYHLADKIENAKGYLD